MSGVEAVATTGYRLTLPAGWGRITTGDGSEQSIARYLAIELRRLSGAERVLAEREIGARLRRAVAQAEEAGALDLYFSSIAMGDVVVATRFSVAVAFFGASATGLDDAELADLAAVDPTEVAALRLADARAVRTVERRTRRVSEIRAAVEESIGDSIDPVAVAAGLPAESAARRGAEAIAQAEAADASITEIRVSYLVEIPESHGAYLVAVIEVAESRVSGPQIQLFDAILSTLRWVS